MVVEMLTPSIIGESTLSTNAEPYLAAVEAGDATLTLRENNLTVSELVEISRNLQTAPETLMGQQAVEKVLGQSGFRPCLLPYRLFFPRSAFQAYLGMYAQFDPRLKEKPVPAEDVYVVLDETQKPIAFIQRSSLWSAITDGVATAREYRGLMEVGEIITVGGVQPCFRREVKEAVTGWRQLGFTQADVELAALTNEQITPQFLDTEATSQMIEALLDMGIPPQMIQIRVNNFMDIVYKVLGEDIPFLEKETFGWQYLDRMATARVINNEAESNKLKEEALNMIKSFAGQKRLSEEAEEFLRRLVNEGQYSQSILENSFPEAYEAFPDLFSLVSLIRQRFPEISIFIDPLSIRGGTPGYDRTTMQADIITPDKIFPEVGGGGAYQKAAKLSWQVLSEESPPDNFYMVGFALGLLRIKTAREYIR